MERFFQASKRQVPPFSVDSHPSMQNRSTFQLIYHLLFLRYSVSLQSVHLVTVFSISTKTPVFLRLICCPPPSSLHLSFSSSGLRKNLNVGKITACTEHKSPHQTSHVLQSPILLYREQFRFILQEAWTMRQHCLLSTRRREDVADQARCFFSSRETLIIIHICMFHSSEKGLS